MHKNEVQLDTPEKIASVLVEAKALGPKHVAALEEQVKRQSRQR